MDMKKMLAALSEVQAKKPIKETNTTPKAGKKVIKESAPSSLKGWFNKLSEDAQGSKPVAVMAPGNKQAGTGVMTSQDPDVKKILQSLDPAKVQVVMPQQSGQPNQQTNQNQQQNQNNQNRAPSAAPQANQTVSEDELDEKIEGGVHINPEKRGMFNGKNKSELMSQYNKLKASGPHKKGSPAFTKMKELAFAIRAKSGWGKVKESKQLDEISPAILMPASVARQKQADAYKGPDAAKIKGDLAQRSAKLKSTSEKRSAAKKEFETEVNALVDAGISVARARHLGKSQQVVKALADVYKKQKNNLTSEAEIPHTGGVDVSGAALGAGRSKTTLEAESPSNAGVSGTSRGGIGMGRSKTTLESRAKADNKAEKAGKKVTKDLEYDMGHKGKDDTKAERAGKKVAKDIEYDEKKAKMKKKKKLKESHENRLQAAHHLGRAHALAKHGYNSMFDEGSEEHGMYHEGYKQGLDECYGKMMPIHGLVHGMHDEMDESHVVDDMASFGAHTPSIEEEIADEGNAFGYAARRTPKGKHIKIHGHDTGVIKNEASLDDMDEADTMMAFESWDAQLSNLLTEYNDINEGLSVSVSDQEGMPKSVTVSATDGAADELLSYVKNAGLGMFGNSDHSEDDEEEAEVVKSMDSPRGIDVVDDHDGMMSLIRKMGGHTQDHDSGDYADEEHDHEEGCNECGMMECDCGPKAMDEAEGCNECGMMECACPGRMDEVETEDQRMYQVAEDDTQPQNPPDDGSANATNATKGNTAQNYAGAMTEEGSEESRSGVWQEVVNALSAAYPDLDPTDSLKPVMRKHGLSFSELDDLARKHDYKDIRNFVDELSRQYGRDTEDGSDLEESEKLDEWANNAGPGNTVSDTTFEQDIEFMTQVIAGGLNKPKRDQTTLPHTETKPSFAGGSIMQTMQRLAAIK